MRNAYKIVVGEPEMKTPLGKPERRWKDSIKIELKELGGEGVIWIYLAQDTDRWRALVSMVKNILFP
jgi:hypothetical protein